MASLKKHKDSPFLYLHSKGLDGLWREKSTKKRYAVPEERRQAIALCAKATQEENERGPAKQYWESWVPTFLDARYPPASPIGRRVRSAWNSVSRYLAEIKVGTPVQLTREQCMAYMAWRKKQTVGGHPVAHNTARTELVYLGVVCEEAVNRLIINRNPAHRLGIGKERGKIKPALSDGHIATIRMALESEPAWMSQVFEVAIHQGCRFSEAAIFTEDVDFRRGSIHFRKTKGDKPFTAPMHPGLLPLLRGLVDVAKTAKADTIIQIPKSGPRRFHRLFDRLRIHPEDAGDKTTFRDLGITFHSTRVTVATRLALGDYSKSKAMRLLNHASELVHSTYQRLQAGDVADAFSVLQIPEHRPGNPSNESPDGPSTS